MNFLNLTYSILYVCGELTNTVLYLWEIQGDILPKLIDSHTFVFGQYIHVNLMLKKL